MIPTTLFFGNQVSSSLEIQPLQTLNFGSFCTQNQQNQKKTFCVVDSTPEMMDLEYDEAWGPKTDLGGIFSQKCKGDDFDDLQLVKRLI